MAMDNKLIGFGVFLIVVSIIALLKRDRREQKNVHEVVPIKSAVAPMSQQSTAPPPTVIIQNQPPNPRASHQGQNPYYGMPAAQQQPTPMPLNYQPIPGTSMAQPPIYPAYQTNAPYPLVGLTQHQINPPSYNVGFEGQAFEKSQPNPSRF